MYPESDMAIQQVEVSDAQNAAYPGKSMAFQNIPWKTINTIILKLIIVAGGIAIGLFLGLIIGFSTGLIEFLC